MFFTKKNPRSAVSLLELSIVIVIIALLLSGVSVSRILIDSAKINSIKNEALVLQKDFIMFGDSYGFIPGNHKNAAQLNVLFGQNTPTACNYTWDGVNGINTVKKRTCAMMSMFAAKALPAPVDLNAADSGSYTGYQLPVASFSQNASWDLATFNLNYASGTAPLPVEVMQQTYSEPQHAFILRNANYVTSTPVSAIAGSSEIFNIQGKTQTNKSLSAMSAKLTNKLDVKFDTGYANTGSIISGRSPVYSAQTDSCYVGPATSNNYSENSRENSRENNNANASSSGAYAYANSTNVETGCIVAFLFQYDL